jgi:hypothetical protein
MLFGGLIALGMVLGACSVADDEAGPIEVSAPSPVATSALALDYAALNDLTVPPLPFAENPDPKECGIPQPYGTQNNAAYLNGMVEGELFQPVVYLYDSHNRNIITTAGFHGAEVEVLLFQANPVLDYYYVRIPDAPTNYREGWVPAPFLSFEPVTLQSAAS